HCKHHVVLRADRLGTPRPRSLPNEDTISSEDSVFSKKEKNKNKLEKDEESSEEVIYDAPGQGSPVAKAKKAEQKKPALTIPLKGRRPPRIYYDPSLDGTPESLISDTTTSDIIPWPYIMHPSQALKVPEDRLMVKDRLKRDHKGQWTLERQIKLDCSKGNGKLIDEKILSHVIEHNEQLLKKTCLCDCQSSSKKKT
uniref:SAP130_C domain-containing protein n=2 Tax=Bursaphelenchus xylophilus TaxID=6326 RepID=A0A1I7SHU5_BURXY